MPEQQQADEPSADQDPIIEVPVAEVIKAQAATLRDNAAGIYLAGCLGGVVGNKYFPESYASYRDALLQQFGNPSDPLAIMLVEQLALAHHNIGLLHLRAAASKHPQAAAGFSAGIAPSRFELRGRPGQVIRDTVVVMNAGQQPAGYRFHTADWTFGDDGGLEYIEDRLAQDSCRPWVRLERKEIRIAVRSSFISSSPRSSRLRVIVVPASFSV